MKIRILSILALGLLVFSGCTNTGAFIATNSTQVELSEGNYTIVAKNVTGSAEASYIIGASTSWGVTTNVSGLFKLDGSSDMLYKDARENLWKAYEAEHGAVEGKKLALVNVQYDADTKNFIIYTKGKITMTADVVEFE